MKYLVTLSTTTQRLVEANSLDSAFRVALGEVDPDLDWDKEAADEMNPDHPEWNLYKEDCNG